MRKILYITILLIVVHSISVKQLFGQTIKTPPHDQSIYYQYSQRQDLNVAYIQNFGLDKETSINVTMIQATDNNSWYKLFTEFQLESLNERQQETINAGREVLQLLVRDNINPCKEAAELDNGYINWRKACFCVVGYQSKTIWIFHTHNVQQIELISERFIYHTYKEAVSNLP